MMRLDELAVGQSAKITAVPEDCERSGRLSALGFIPGVPLRVVRVAPLGDPLSVDLDGREISLRRTEAALIAVGELER